MPAPGTLVLLRRCRVDGQTYTPGQMISYYDRLITDYPIWSLEDPLAEEDTDRWPALTAALGSRVPARGERVANMTGSWKSPTRTPHCPTAPLAPTSTTPTPSDRSTDE